MYTKWLKRVHDNNIVHKKSGKMDMIETKEKFINGDNYCVTQLPARRALRLKAKLIKLFGPILAQIVLPDGEKSENSKKECIVKAVQVLAATIDENVFENLIVEMITGCRKNGVELNAQIIDVEFAGDLATMYLIAAFVMEVNYSNFLELMGIGFLLEDQNPVQAESTKKIYGQI